MKKLFLKISQNSQPRNCVGVSFLTKFQASSLQLYEKRDTLTRVFCYEFCETFKNNFCIEHLRAAANASGVTEFILKT